MSAGDACCMCGGGQVAVPTTPAASDTIAIVTFPAAIDAAAAKLTVTVAYTVATTAAAVVVVRVKGPDGNLVVPQQQVSCDSRAGSVVIDTPLPDGVLPAPPAALVVLVYTTPAATPIWNERYASTNSGPIPITDAVTAAPTTAPPTQADSIAFVTAPLQVSRATTTVTVGVAYAVVATEPLVLVLKVKGPDGSPVVPQVLHPCTRSADTVQIAVDLPMEALPPAPATISFFVYVTPADAPFWSRRYAFIGTGDIPVVAATPTTTPPTTPAPSASPTYTLLSDTLAIVAIPPTIDDASRQLSVTVAYTAATTASFVVIFRLKGPDGATVAPQLRHECHTRSSAADTVVLEWSLGSLPSSPATLTLLVYTAPADTPSWSRKYASTNAQITVVGASTPPKTTSVPKLTLPPAQSCAGVCWSFVERVFASGQPCYCDVLCLMQGNCCADFEGICRSSRLRRDSVVQPEPGQPLPARDAQTQHLRVHNSAVARRRVATVLALEQTLLRESIATFDVPRSQNNVTPPARVNNTASGCQVELLGGCHGTFPVHISSERWEVISKTCASHNEKIRTDVYSLKFASPT